jgi:hypothetical protein
MADPDGTDEDEYGGFVFGDERTTDDESGATADGLDAGTVTAAVLLVVAVVVLAAVAQPLVGAVTNLLGGDSGGAGDSGEVGGAGSATPTGTSEMAGAVAGTERTTETTNEARTATSSVTQRTSVSPTSTQTPQTATPVTTSTATPTTTPTVTPTATPTPAPTDSNESTTGGDGAENGTATPGARSPTIQTVAVTDRSSGGAATFDVAVNVTDPDGDLAGVTVTLVADPGGESRTVAQRRLDASGAQSTGTVTFEVPEGGGTVYEVRVEATDDAGNTAFSLTRVVADGDPDE